MLAHAALVLSISASTMRHATAYLEKSLGTCFTAWFLIMILFYSGAGGGGR